MDMRPYFPDIFRNSALFYFLRRKYAHFDSVLCSCIIYHWDRTNLFGAICTVLASQWNLLKSLQMLDPVKLNLALNLICSAYFHDVSPSSLAICFIWKKTHAFRLCFFCAPCLLFESNKSFLDNCSWLFHHEQIYTIVTILEIIQS